MIIKLGPVNKDKSIVHEIPENIFALIGKNLFAEVPIKDMQGLYEQIIAENCNMACESRRK